MILAACRTRVIGAPFAQWSSALEHCSPAIAVYTGFCGPGQGGGRLLGVTDRLRITAHPARGRPTRVDH